VNDARCLDASYLLGACPRRTQEFPRHLRNCPRRRSAVQQLARLPGLLALTMPGTQDSATPSGVGL